MMEMLSEKRQNVAHDNSINANEEHDGLAEYPYRFSENDAPIQLLFNLDAVPSHFLSN